MNFAVSDEQRSYLAKREADRDRLSGPGLGADAKVSTRKLRGEDGFLDRGQSFEPARL